MAKKKSAEKTTESREADAGAEHAGELETAQDQASADEALIIEAATPAYVADEAAFLAAEVHAHLSKRGELAERIAREIEATERRLEELRRSLVLLSPPAPTAEPTRQEKKAKKPTLKKAEKKSERKLAPDDDVEGATSDSAGDAAESVNSQAGNGAAA